MHSSGNGMNESVLLLQESIKIAVLYRRLRRKVPLMFQLLNTLLNWEFV